MALLPQEVVNSLVIQAAGGLTNPGLGSVNNYRAVLASAMNSFSSIHSYQEHAENRAQRRGGQPSKDALHARFGTAYGASADLFLARKLRDAMVHNTLEIIGFNQKQDPATDAESSPSHASTFLITEPLLKMKKVFNQRLRDHIDRFGNDIDLSRLMIRVNQRFGRLP